VGAGFGDLCLAIKLLEAGIREITGQGIVTEDGVERPVDCILLGTGFVVDSRI
jgi:hypothetical protein